MARFALVDGHVHLHPRHDVWRVLAAARSNLEATAAALGTPQPRCAMVVLTEIEGVDRFAELLGRASASGCAPPGPRAGGLLVSGTREETSLRVRAADGYRSLAVIAGRQVLTAEGLEVLAFPLRVGPPDGEPIRSVLAATARAGAFGVIPWGFGKWTLGRRALLEALLAERAVGSVEFLLADTGHRPAWAPVPRPLRAAGDGDRPVLTGSDPLPLWGEEDRAGRCAFEIEGVFEAQRPAEGLVKALSARRGSVRRVEGRVGLLDFAAKQIAMQVRKRVRR